MQHFLAVTDDDLIKFSEKLVAIQQVKFISLIRIIVIYWMTIISFIFHFTRDLVFMPERSEGIIKVPREVKNKGYESHPIRNFA